MSDSPEHHPPPKWADVLLAWFCAPHLLEEIQGDLHELFHQRVRRQGLWRARWGYWLDVVRFFRPYVLRRKRPTYEQARGPIMLKNYLVVALRSVRRHPGYSAINVVGLAVGIACCLLIALYVQDELSYDRFHAKADRIYRVVDEEHKEGGIITRTASSPARLMTALGEDFAAVERGVRFMRYSVFNVPTISRGAERSFNEPDFFFADSTVFDIFSFSFVAGHPETALDEPMSVVLTEAMAEKYFGSENPVGQTLPFDTNVEFRVTGVLEDLPSNSHIHFDFLGSFSSLGRIEGDWIYQYWNWPPMYTYVLLPVGYDPAALEAQLPAFVAKHLGDDAAARRSFSLQPLTSIHLHSHREDELEPNGDIAYVYIFSIVAAFILLIACINFMNLTTARSASRAKEVGMRKVLGARRVQLIRQFLSESVLLSMLALALAIGLALVLLPAFNAVSGKAIAPTDVTGSFMVLLTGIVLLVGLLAGSYPALYLSAFQPVKVLKGMTIRGTTAAAVFRKGLVVVQFAISCVLIVGTAVIYQQLDYLQTKKLGFDKEHVVVADLGGNEADRDFDALKQQWLQHPNVLAATATSDVPPSTADLYDFPVVLREGRTDSLEMLTLTIDHDFVETFGLEIVAGRDLSEDVPTDKTEGFLLNESAVRKLGLDAPIGQKLTLYHYADGPAPKNGRVVGVVKDFHYTSLHQQIDPILFYILPVTSEISYYNYLSVRLRPTDVQETLAFLEREWQAFQPGRPFAFTFLDDQFDALYRAEQRLGTLFSYAALLAILVACLGLFGLAAFTTQQRTKEIGVRKVLGASVPQIVVLLSKEFLLLVGLAVVVAVPVAYVAMHRWLDDFAYRIELSWGIFLIVGLAALGIAFLTVSYQSIKAALADPVTALRYE